MRGFTQSSKIQVGLGVSIGIFNQCSKMILTLTVSGATGAAAARTAAACTTTIAAAIVCRFAHNAADHAPPPAASHAPVLREATADFLWQSVRLLVDIIIIIIAPWVEGGQPRQRCYLPLFPSLILLTLACLDAGPRLRPGRIVDFCNTFIK